MAQRRNILCGTAACLLYWANRLVFIGSGCPAIAYFCRCFLNDILCPLFFLPVTDFLLSCAGYPLRRTRTVFLIMLGASLIWEFLGPRINPRSVFDPLDFLCYFIGTVIYWRCVRSHPLFQRETADGDLN